MRLTDLTPMLWVEDLGKAICFHRDILGFDCVNRPEGWACLRKDEAEVMISLPSEHEPFDKLQFTGSSISAVRMRTPSRTSTTECGSSRFAITMAISCSLASDRIAATYPVKN